jgi:hypothetical protein
MSMIPVHTMAWILNCHRDQPTDYQDSTPLAQYPATASNRPTQRPMDAETWHECMDQEIGSDDYEEEE